MTKKTSDDPLDKLAESVRSRPPVKKSSKANRTHALQEPNYSILQRYCRSKGMPMSELLDGLIAAFLEKVKDEIPPPTAIAPDGDGD